MIGAALNFIGKHPLSIVGGIAAIYLLKKREEHKAMLKNMKQQQMLEYMRRQQILNTPTVGGVAPPMQF